MSPVIKQLVDALVPLAVLGIAYLGRRLQVFLDTRTKNELARGVIERTSNRIATLVAEAEQTTVRDAKKAGTWDGDAAAKVKADIIARVHGLLAKADIDDLAKVLGVQADSPFLDAFLAAKAEEAVLGLRMPLRSDLIGDLR